MQPWSKIMILEILALILILLMKKLQKERFLKLGAKWNVYYDTGPYSSYATKVTKGSILKYLLLVKTITVKNIDKKLPLLDIPNEIKACIQKEVRCGKMVIVSEMPFHTKGWKGEKYIVREDINGMLIKTHTYFKECKQVSGRRWPFILFRFNPFTFTVHSKNIEKILPPLKIPAEAKDNIREEVAKGKAVLVSEIPFQVDNWVGEKYLVLGDGVLWQR